MAPSPLTSGAVLTRDEFLRLLQVGLLIEEELVVREYADLAKRLRDDAARTWVLELVRESATHKGELTALIGSLEAMR